MSQNNIYIANHEEISRITDNGRPCDIGVQLDIFDHIHGCKHDDRARAEYMRAFHPSMLSVKDKQLLGDAE